jgi:hypothetical protein
VHGVTSRKTVLIFTAVRTAETRNIRSVKVFLVLIHYALRHEDVWGSGGIVLPFFTSALKGAPAAFPQRIRCIGDRAETHIRSGHYGEGNNFLHLSGNEPQLLRHPARSLVSIPTELSRMVSGLCIRMSRPDCTEHPVRAQFCAAES